jgi:hypothetical protein
LEGLGRDKTGRRWDRGGVLARGQFSDVGSPGYTFGDGFVWAPLCIQGLASDGRDIRSLRGVLELSRIDDNSEMFLVIFVVVIQVKECRPVGGGYAGAGHALHLDVVRRG